MTKRVCNSLDIVNRNVLSLALFLILLPAVSGGGESFVSLSRPIKGLVTAIPSADNRTIAVLRVGKIFKEPQRKGFFRIGLLPLVVADQVIVEVEDPVLFQREFTNVHNRLFSSHGRVPVELRHVEFKFPSEPSPRLQAGRVRLKSQGQWELSDGVIFRVSDNEIQCAQAVLQITGPGAGNLRSQDAPHALNLFWRNNSTNNPPTKSESP